MTWAKKMKRMMSRTPTGCIPNGNERHRTYLGRFLDTPWQTSCYLLHKAKFSFFISKNWFSSTIREVKFTCQHWRHHGWDLWEFSYVLPWLLLLPSFTSRLSSPNTEMTSWLRRITTKRAEIARARLTTTIFIEVPAKSNRRGVNCNKWALKAQTSRMKNSWK